jgi:hypothetical protein
MSYPNRKGKGTRDYLSLLSTDIDISFEDKKNPRLLSGRIRGL